MEYVTTIRPSSNRFSLRSIFSLVLETFRYWELLYFFIWKNIKVRYKRTVIGAGWAIIQPFMTMVVFTIFFGKLAKLPSYDLPYPVFYYSGLLCWSFFASSVQNAAGSIIGHRSIITKVYFPRIILPLSAVLSGLVDFFIALSILIPIMLYYNVFPGFEILFLPLFIFLIIFTALSFGIWLASLSSIYRDIQYAIPFLIQILLFASPVVYPASLVPEKLKAIYGLNPMAGIVEGFRWSLTGAGNPPGLLFGVSLVAVFALFITGLMYFKKVEGRIIDVI